MKIIVLLAVFYIAPAMEAVAQFYFYNDRYYANNLVIEAGISTGVMNCLTDLGGHKGPGQGFIKDLNWSAFRPCFGAYTAATWKEAAVIRLEAVMGRIASGDHLLKWAEPDLTQRYGRNLSFRSKIIEFQLVTEIHPLCFNPNREIPLLSPYITTGIGRFSFNPQAKLNEHWYDLHPLRLEGQDFAEYPDRKPYRLHQWNMLAGTGIRYEIGATINVRFEIVYRLLFTDYLDDVSTTYIDPSLFQHYLSPDQATIARQLYSRMQELQPGYQVSAGMQRGDASEDDTYFTMQVKIGWVIRKRIRR
jgi:hypothetical protein